MPKLWAFIKRHRDFWFYALFGFLASVINIVAFMILKRWFAAHYLLANTLAWFISVVFGFFTNKTLVFRSKYSTGTDLLIELISFFFFRGMSLLVDSAIMMICITFLGMSSFLSKIIDQVLVGLLNYATSRYTFSQEQKKMTDRLRQLRHERQKRHRNDIKSVKPMDSSTIERK